MILEGELRPVGVILSCSRGEASLGDTVDGEIGRGGAVTCTVRGDIEEGELKRGDPPEGERSTMENDLSEPALGDLEWYTFAPSGLGEGACTRSPPSSFGDGTWTRSAPLTLNWLN